MKAKLKLGTMYYHEFAVHGVGRFPIDMLRYDSCFPTDQESALAIMDSNKIGKDHKLIRLSSIQDNSNWEPTKGRWESFGWRVRTAM
jgi:hypothetical protein